VISECRTPTLGPLPTHNVPSLPVCYLYTRSLSQVAVLTAPPDTAGIRKNLEGPRRRLDPFIAARRAVQHN